MKSLRIYVNDLELDYVIEDMKIREENSSFTNDIQVQHTTWPIRIIEGSNTVKALGDFTINSARKRKKISCQIALGAIFYDGFIIQKEPIPGFRKCDLKFGPAINAIMDKKIASFFPTESVINAENPEAYSDEATELFDVQDAWVDKANDLERKIYPEVKWSLPMIYYPEKFGTDLKKEDSNYFYRKYINNQAYSELLKNEIFYYQDDFEVRNYNVVAPRVFILSPIYHAFASIGYSLKGSVIDSGYFRRMLLGSKNDNMVKIPRKPPGTFLDLEDAAWQEVWAWNPITSLQLRSFAKEVNFEVPIDGNFVLNYNYQKSDQLAGFELEHEGDIFFRDRPYGDYNYSGQVNFTIEEGQSRTVTFRYISDQQSMPTNYSFEWLEDLEELDYLDMHPTIDFSRYIPDWSVADYINNFQALFNWKVDFDHVEKTLSLNFNTEDYLQNGKPVIINKSLQIEELLNIDAESYYLKFANESDFGSGVSIHQEFSSEDDTTEVMPTEFKKYDYRNGTTYITEAIEEKEGVGLMLIDPLSYPRTLEFYEGKSLDIIGQNGILESFWKIWLLFKLNAVNLTLNGPFTSTDVYLISKFKKIYIDHTLFLVTAMEYTEEKSGLFNTSLELKPVTF